MNGKLLAIAALAVVFQVGTAFAQPQERPQRERERRSEQAPPQRHLRTPLMQALDANGDGVIDAQEIANASEALKTLDKDGDGQLTQQELRPQRPPRTDGRGRPGDRPRPRPPERQN